ncbi:MAG: SDR family NAD(P)-dependent oxidoreductase [Halieaceae bacterium]|jgi:NAD(P)-dependent dehydrogenase (short-subunit alcohol dehydrogenase family)|nr:SDR family NAD(P)-dependent oxidoreductase [Halieaceae bacterium]
MKTLLITGASSGIGRATALAAAHGGWRVLACGRDIARLDALRGEAPGIETLAFDVSDREACIAALRGLSPDVALLNAGSCEYVDIEDWDPALFRRVFDANFFSVVNCVDALLPRLQAGNQLVIVDSLARLLPFTRSEAYGASKAALHYLTRCLEVDLRDRGVVVQSVSPGFVRTPLTDRNGFAMPMLVEPEDAARAILRSIDRGDRSGYFPSLFAAIIRGLALLPERLQVGLCRRLARRTEAAA